MAGEKKAEEKDAVRIMCDCGPAPESAGCVCGYNPHTGKDCLYVWADEGGQTRIIELAGVKFCPICGDELARCTRKSDVPLPSFVLGHIFRKPVRYEHPADSPSYEFMGKSKPRVTEI